MTETGTTPTPRKKAARRDDGEVRGRLPPAAVDDEQAFIGVLLLYPNDWDKVAGLLVADDFYDVKHKIIFDAMAEMFRAHQAVDAVTLANKLRVDGFYETVGGGGYLLELQSAAGARSHLQQYAWNVLSAAQARQMILVGSQITDLGFERAEGGFEQAKQLLHDATSSMLRSGLVVQTPLLSDLLDNSPTWQKADWIIPGMLARKHRLVVAARGGRGKSTFIRQVVCFLAAGFHPFLGDSLNLRRCDMRTSLVVDLENDEQAWMIETRAMMEFLRARGGMWPLPIALHALGGISYDPVQNRSDRLDLFARLREVMPDNLVIGPLYKLDQKSGAEWHQTAGRIQDLLDDIRGTFNCSIMVEAHVGSSGAAVRGAKDWEFWPEMVKRFAFFPGDRTRLKVEDVRTPRFRQLYDWWPTELAKHTNTMPQRAVWPAGYWPADGGGPMWDRNPNDQMAGILALAPDPPATAAGADF